MDRRTMEMSLRPIVVGLVLLLTLIVVLGAAIRNPQPHDIPVGLVAPPAVVQQLTAGFEGAAPGAFTLTTYEAEAEARAAIDRRDVVGSLIVGPAGPLLVVAGAAGDAITGGVTAAFTNAFRAQDADLAVEIVHPFAPGDPHGIVLFFLVLATLISSVVVAALVVLPEPRRSWVVQVGILATFALAAGILGTLATSWLIGGYGEGIWLVAGLVALLSLAVGAVIAACARAFGGPGVALGALVVVLVGLVSSGGPLGSEFLPDVYRALAPWLPVEPVYSAMRGALYFDGTGVTGPAVLLAAWAAVGIVALATQDLIRPVARQAAPAAA